MRNIQMTMAKVIAVQKKLVKMMKKSIIEGGHILLIKNPIKSIARSRGTE